MSTTYFAWTVPVHSHELDVDRKSLDDVAPLMERDVAKGRVLFSASRNDWLAGIIVTSVAPTFGAFGLMFLRDVITFLDETAMSKASGDIERLLRSAEISPSLFAKTIHPNNTSDDVLSALVLAVPARDPEKGPEGEEEGDGFVYLFGYLKSLLSLFDYAKQQKLSVIHVRYEFPK